MMDQAFGHWLAGFIDGEGCFSIDPKADGRSACRMTLTLRDDDAEILQVIQQETGLGTLKTKAPRPHQNPQLTWRVVTKQDCLSLIAILDQCPLRAKKANDYKIWRKAVGAWDEIQGGKYHGAWNLPFWMQMRKLRQQLKSTRAYC